VVRVPEQNKEWYSVHFARFASRLEKHLLSNGVACSQADVIIEESSSIFFERLNKPGKILSFFKKKDPLSLFIESSVQAITMHIPEASITFGSYDAIRNCLR
jgi:hypothetical protein